MHCVMLRMQVNKTSTCWHVNNSLGCLDGYFLCNLTSILHYGIREQYTYHINVMEPHTLHLFGSTSIQ